MDDKNKQAEREHADRLFKRLPDETIEQHLDRFSAGINAAQEQAEPVANHSRVCLSGAQLLETLGLIAPDRDTDREQLESDVTIQYGGGHDGTGYYCWVSDYPEEGAILPDGEGASSILAAPPEPSRQVVASGEAPECTCPSGNGSLRHPCPVHPASPWASINPAATLADRLDSLPEINFSNYDQNDVEALNAWAIEAYTLLAATRQNEMIAHPTDEKIDLQTIAQLESLARKSHSGRHPVYMSPDDARALLAASPADQVGSAARELVSQIEKTAPVDDHGHRLCMNSAFIKLKELL